MKYYEDPILGKGRAADVTGGTGGGGRGACWHGSVFHAEDGAPNTGGGGGGGYSSTTEKTTQAGAGGSGIVVIRNAR